MKEAQRLLKWGIVTAVILIFVFARPSAAQRQIFHVLVKLDAESSLRPGTFFAKIQEESFSLQQMRALPNLSRTSQKDEGKIFRIDLAADALSTALEKINRKAGVVYAEEDVPVHAFFTPNDPSFGSQWNFGKVNLESAWDFDVSAPLYGGDPSVVVAVIDTGVAYENYVVGDTTFQQAPDFASTTFVAGYDFVNDDLHANDDNGHGTHVAGTIAESTNNGVSAAGVAFQSTVMPIKVLDEEGVGSVSDVASGIDFAVLNGADVLNLSLGASAGSQTLRDAVQRAIDAGLVVVAATGNNAQATIAYPAAYDRVIAVSALGRDDILASYSNYGTGVTLSAPGGDDGDYIWQQGYSNLDSNNIPLDYTSFGLVGFQGTSQATPHVSGAAALLLARGASANAVATLLASSASDLGTSGYDTQYGFGRLNIQGALALFVNDTTPPVTVLSQTPSAPDGSLGYFRTTPSITLTGTDSSGSGVVSISYWWDSGAPTTYATSLSAAEGTHTLHYSAVDAAGNVEATQSALFLTDTVAPTVHLTQPGATVNNPLVRIAGTVSDATSGVGTLSLAGKPVALDVNGKFSFQRELPLGKNVLEFLVTDRAGTSGSPTQIVTVTAKERIIVGTENGGPQMVVYSEKGQSITNFFAFSKTLRGGVFVSSGDIDGDGSAEILAGAAEGSAPEIRIYNNKGKLIRKWNAFANTLRGGVALAGGDINGDGTDEILAGIANSGSSQIRIFNSKGKLLGQFSAFPKSMKGGIRLASGDIDGNGKDEIIVSQAATSDGSVGIFRSDGKRLGKMQVFAKTFRGGIHVASGDITGDGKAEIVVAPAAGSGPQIRVFQANGKLLSQFFAYETSFRGGVDLAVGDITGDGKAEIVTGPGQGGAPRVKAFSKTGTLVRQFSVYTKNFRGGIHIATGLTD